MRRTRHLPGAKGKTHCEVCGKLLLPIDIAASKKSMPIVCISIVCREFVSARKGLEPNLYQCQLKQHQDTLGQIEADKAEGKVYQNKVEQIENSENRLILKKILKNQSEKLKQSPFIVTVPFGRQEQTTLSEDRIAIYRSHLASVIQSAFPDLLEEDDPGDIETEISEPIEVGSESEINPELQRLCGQLCGICQGDCCGLGGDQAFLTKSTITRVRQLWPELTADEMLELYMSHLCEITAETGCVNQSETGCVLPMSLRADICNDFNCSALESVITRFKREPDGAPILIIKRAHHLWSRYKPGLDSQVTDVVMINN